MNRTALAAALALLVAPLAGAQPCGTDPSSQFTKVVATPTLVTFPTPTLADLSAGHSAEQTFSVEVQPIARDRLRPWYLCFQADAPVWPSPALPPKTVDALEWSINGSAWAPVMLAPRSISPTFVGRQTVAVRVRVRVSYDDAPGLYGPLPLRFTASH